MCLSSVTQTLRKITSFDIIFEFLPLDKEINSVELKLNSENIEQNAREENYAIC